MLRFKGLFAGTVLALGLALPSYAKAEEVVVFAAASMKTALDAVAADFTAKTGHQVVMSYAGSNVLAKQIIEGAPADIFISAAEIWMDEVEKAGAIIPGSRIDLLGNRLVLIAHGRDAAKIEIRQGFDLKSLLDGGKLAMALVEAVPAGQYGKAALSALGVWEEVAPSVAQADNVRAALALVAQGEAPYGITYATDAAAEDHVTVVGEFPAETHPAILYPAALLEGATPADRAFYEALSSEASDAIFAAHGFVILPAQDQP